MKKGDERRRFNLLKEIEKIKPEYAEKFLDPANESPLHLFCKCEAMDRLEKLADRYNYCLKKSDLPN